MSSTIVCDMQSVQRLVVPVASTLLVAATLHFVIKIFKLFKKKRRNQEILGKFPGPKPHWLLGSLIDLPDDIRGLQKAGEWVKEYGEVLPLWFGPFHGALQLCGPTYFQAITATAEPKDNIAYKFVGPWIGDGLLTSKGQKWARNRRLLTPAFHFDILKPYVDIFNDSADILTNKWIQLLQDRKEEILPVELFDHISLMALDSLMRCIFGVSGNVQNVGKRNPYIQSVYSLTELIIKRFRFFPHYSDFLYSLSPSGYRFRKACDIAHKFTRDVINKRKIERDNGETHRSEKKYLDFIDMLLDAKDEDGNGLSYQEICDEVDTFMFEGHDTTASAMSWILFNLASHPEIQQRCREEINAVLGENKNMTWDDVSKLTYLTMCVKESLRLHPPVPSVAREITKPLTFPDGRTIPAGTWVGIGIYLCHHNEKYWPNPKVYDPERFNPENSKDRHPHAFMPFSAGPRNCIGQHFALHEIKTCIAKILLKFELEADKSRPPHIVPEIVLRTRNGLWINVKPLS